MHQDDLYEKLNGFSISSNEEKLTKALDSTHISSSTSSLAKPSIFSLPSQQPQNQFTQPPQQPIYSGDIQNKTGYIEHNMCDSDPAAANNWNSGKTTNQHDNSQDGWGEDPPSYTAILQGTYFGFNSILKPSDAISNLSPQQTTNAQAFSRYKNSPVSFISAAKEATSDNNNSQ
ncbi:hypothetical protein BD408DRAFT_420123 [Parasitella parasitica]|nr:hypothetical protein BD408DRAFT_420123 [Parasitella parasitica]